MARPLVDDGTPYHGTRTHHQIPQAMKSILFTTITMLSLYKSGATFTISTMKQRSWDIAKNGVEKCRQKYSRTSCATANNGFDADSLSSSSPSTTVHTIKEALQNATQQMTDHRIVEPDFSALHLLAHASNIHFSELMAKPNRVVDGLDLELFHNLVRRRLEHEPIQYILGMCIYSFNYSTILMILLDGLGAFVFILFG